MSEIRIEQYGPAGSDGRDILAMPVLQLVEDAVVLTSGGAAAAMTNALNPLTRTLAIRCEGTSARVAVGLRQGANAAAAASGFTQGNGASLNDGELRWFSIPESLWGKTDVRVVVIDRS